MSQVRIGRPCGGVYIASLYHEDDTVQMAKVVRVDDLRVPIHVALGRYEAATQEELDELITDLRHELERRAA